MQGRRNFWSGEMVRADVHVSHFGDTKPLAGNLRWRLEGDQPHGHLGTITVAAGEVRSGGPIEVAAPEVRHDRVLRLYRALESGGKLGSENYLDIPVVP